MKKVILSIAVMAAVTAMTGVGQVSAANEMLAIGIVLEDDGFADVQLESLNPAVQASINALAGEYDIKSLKFNAEKQLTKVELIKKDDQTKKKVYLDAEGKEVQKDKNESNKEATETSTQQETPSVEVFAAQQQDDGYANIKFEELNEKVQNAVRALIDKYDINSLQYNVDKKITKVTATNKEDQSVKTVYLDDEGKEVNPDAAPRNTEAPELL